MLHLSLRRCSTRSSSSSRRLYHHHQQYQQTLTRRLPLLASSSSSSSSHLSPPLLLRTSLPAYTLLLRHAFSSSSSSSSPTNLPKLKPLGLGSKTPVRDAAPILTDAQVSLPPTHPPVYPSTHCSRKYAHPPTHPSTHPPTQASIVKEEQALLERLHHVLVSMEATQNDLDILKDAICQVRTLIQPPTHPPTHPPIPLPTHLSSTHPPTHPPTHLSIQSTTYPPTHPPTHLPHTQVEDLFMVCVVGEFNAGKSKFINALLGDTYLKEGTYVKERERQRRTDS